MEEKTFGKIASHPLFCGVDAALLRRSFAGEGAFVRSFGEGEVIRP